MAIRYGVFASFLTASLTTTALHASSLASLRQPVLAQAVWVQGRSHRREDFRLNRPSERPGNDHLAVIWTLRASAVSHATVIAPDQPLMSVRQGRDWWCAFSPSGCLINSQGTTSSGEAVLRLSRPPVTRSDGRIRVSWTTPVFLRVLLAVLR